jgi:NAD(P)-dependent dehydrogenase (short-subunit alcohol dehydrogenase family)
MVADLDEAGAVATVAEIGRLGGTATSFQVDVSVDSQVEGLIGATIDHLGRLDCAFNNAGIGQRPALIVDTPDATLDRIFEVNLKGAWLCMKHEIRHMRDHGGGSIVNTASALGLRPRPTMAAYGSIRAALVYLTAAAALECAPWGIRVNAVCPGPTKTPQLAAAADDVEQWYAELVTRVPLGRLGEPPDIAQAAVWLSSDEASYITGLALPVDGGERL